MEEYILYRNIDSPTEFKGFKGVYIVYALAALIVGIVMIIIGSVLFRGVLMFLWIAVFSFFIFKGLGFLKNLSKKDYYHFAKKASSKTALFR